MADKTLGFKVTDEVYDKTKALIETSGLTSKDWLEKAVALYEVNSLKNGISGDYSADLEELEAHTTRIYTLISNMIARSTYLKDSAVKEVLEKLDSKESIISDLQEQNKTLKATLNELEVKYTAESEEKAKLDEKLTSMQMMLDNNQALIDEYKSKNDVLNGLVAQYSGYSEENEKLKADVVHLKAESAERIAAITKENEQLMNQLNQAVVQMAKDKEQHETTLNITIERKDLEREKALIELERHNQEQLKAENEKVRSLYDELEEIRKSSAAQIEELKRALDEANNKVKELENANKK